MDWSETMKRNAELASPSPAPGSQTTDRSLQAAPWDPFDVWMTRIKQPRDDAARQAAENLVL
jgi:hypothetical protein